jgi:hypothetical protein
MLLLFFLNLRKERKKLQNANTVMSDEWYVIKEKMWGRNSRPIKKIQRKNYSPPPFRNRQARQLSYEWNGFRGKNRGEGGFIRSEFLFLNIV